MTKTNKRHAKISREALMQGIADMEAMKPIEKEQLTQKEAIEIAADAVWKLLAMGYSLAEIVELMKKSFGLSLDKATVRSYLRQVKAANDAKAAAMPTKRRGRKTKPATSNTDPATADLASASDSSEDEDEAMIVVVTEIKLHDQTDDDGRDRDATGSDGDAAESANPDASEDDLDLDDAFLDQFPPDADHDMEGRG